LVAPGSQVVPLQQPFGHKIPSQASTQMWPSQCCVPAPHARQAAPLGPPHTASASPGWQLPLASQHPFGQESASQTHAPATHSWPVAHARHAAPPEPHAAFVVGFTQVAPSQQPVGQEFASQTHALLTHSCPPAQKTHAAPPAPQNSLAFPGSQVVPLQQPVAQSDGSQYATQV
jgi:hypothetical protein